MRRLLPEINFRPLTNKKKRFKQAETKQNGKTEKNGADDRFERTYASLCHSVDDAYVGLPPMSHEVSRSISAVVGALTAVTAKCRPKGARLAADCKV